MLEKQTIFHQKIYLLGYYTNGIEARDILGDFPIHKHQLQQKMWKVTHQIEI